MKIPHELDRNYSTATINTIAEYVLESQDRFDELMGLFLNGEKRMVQMAAWPLGKAAHQRPKWFLKHMKDLLVRLRTPSHEAVSRNIYRSFQYIDIPEDYQAEVLDLCIRDLMDSKKPVAVKVFAMTTAANIAEYYPELKNELRLAIESNLDNCSAGYRSRARRILPRLE